MQKLSEYIRKRLVLTFSNSKYKTGAFLSLFKEVALEIGKNLVKDYNIIIRTPKIDRDGNVVIDVDISTNEDIMLVPNIVINSWIAYVRENYITLDIYETDLYIAIYNREGDDIVTLQVDKQYYLKRNKEIYRLHKERGLTYKQIATRFGISVERARQIFLKEKRLIDQAERKKNLGNDDFLDAINNAKLSLGSKQPTMRMYNTLARAGLISGIEARTNTLNNYSDEDLLLIKNMGPESIRVLREAQKIFDKSYMTKDK